MFVIFCELNHMRVQHVPRKCIRILSFFSFFSDLIEISRIKSKKKAKGNLKCGYIFLFFFFEHPVFNAIQRGYKFNIISPK